MKVFILTVFQVVCCSLVFAQHNLNLKDLEGKWYIQATNFPMWLKGDKQNPSFNYTVIESSKGVKRLLDEVKFVKKGKEKAIVGFDTPLNASNTKFKWRGKGILGVLKSKWEILYWDKAEEWAIIGFEKTLFTPKGYDIISRKRNLVGVIEQKVQQRLAQLGISEKLSPLKQE